LGYSRSVEFNGPAGRLEGILQGRLEDRPARAAVVCHPHPLAGGTMHTKAVHRTAQALEKAGHLVLRFNFRGAGGSAGSHDRGIGEQEDARAALDWLVARNPTLPVTMAGFSFGSWVGLLVGARDPRVDALVALAAPVSLFDFTFVRPCTKPKLFVHGTADEIAPLSALEAFYPSISDPKSLKRLEGASHLLTRHLDEAEEAIAAFARALPSKGAP
jgi:alpha/beta superfamily hydrolase